MGTLTIDTGFDLSGAERGYKKLEQATKETAQKTANEIAGIGNSFDDVSAAIMKQSATVDELRRKYDALASGEVMPKELTSLESQLVKVQKETDKLAAEFDKLAQEKEALEAKVIDVGGKPFLSESDTARLAEINAKLDEISPKWEEAELKAADYQMRIDQIRANPLDTDEGIKLASSLSVAEKKLSEMNEKAAQVSKTAPKAMHDTSKKLSEVNSRVVQLNKTGPKAMNNTSKAASGLGGTLEKTVKRIKSLFMYAMVYSVLRTVFKNLRDYIGIAMKDNKAFVNSFAQVKGNLQTAFQPILQVIIPMLATLMQWLARVTQYLVMFISALSGKSIASMQAAAKNMNKLAAATKKAGQEAKKILAPFDEINQVVQSTADASDASADGGIAPQYGDMDELTGKMRDTIIAITIMVSAALLVLGAILTFTGVNIPLGVALMAVGAATLVSTVAVNWNSLSSQMKSTIGKIALIVSGALLVLGAIFAFTGVNLPLGIALMALGAVGLVSAVALSWNNMSDELKTTIGIIATIVSTALLVLGAIFAFTGVNVPLGIAFMVIGAMGLVAAVPVVWNSLEPGVQQTIKLIFAIVSAAVLVLGAILLFTGAATALGLGLLLAGAIGLKETIPALWDSLEPEVKETIKTIFTIVSAALLVLGFILLFTGAAIPLGLGLLAVGAIGLAASIAKSTELTDDIKETIAIITLVVSAALLVLGAVLSFSGANIPLGIGLLAVGAIGLVASVMQSTALTDEIRQTIATIIRIASGALIALGIILLVWGIIPLGLALLVAGVGLMFVGIFTSPGETMLEKIKSFVNGVIDLFENMANGVIGIFERLLNWIVDGLNKISFDLPDMLGGKTIGFNIKPVTLGRVSIPRLATGTVVPPNKEFMAILGDNKNEPEIVSPESTMKQAFLDALSESGYGKVTIIAEEDAGLIRHLKFRLAKEDNRQGGQFSNRLVIS